MTVFTDEQKKLLEGKLNPDHVKTRKAGTTTLSYLEGWAAIAEANRIFGFDGWERETVDLIQTNRDLVQGQRGPQWRVSYIAKVRVTVGRTIVREGTGYGSGFGPENDVGAAVEGAVKEAETDAMKRALMTFGNKFGLALYDKTQAGVGYDEDEKPNPAFTPAKGGGYKDAKGYTDGEMNSAGKKFTIEEISNDLLDATSLFLLGKLQQQWKPTLEKWRSHKGEEGNEYSWFKLAMELFDAKRKELTDGELLNAG